MTSSASTPGTESTGHEKVSVSGRKVRHLNFEIVWRLGSRLFVLAIEVVAERSAGCVKDNGRCARGFTSKCKRMSIDA